MIINKIVFKLNTRRYNQKYRKANKKKHITFISQNCIGGVLYNMLGLSFDSPTINMFIEDENFVKLVENPQHYFSLDAEPHEESHKDENNPLLQYPTIRVDDIILCCQHYKDCESAIEAWNRRRLRINYEEIYVIACSWDLHENPEWIKRINKVKYPVVIFTTEDFDCMNCVHLKNDKYTKDESGKVKPALTSFDGKSGKRHFVDEFDFVEWINAK